MTDERDNELDEAVRLLLQRPGLEGWARVCMTLLSLTDGIERFIDSEDEHPHRDLKERVQQALSTNDADKLREIAGLHVFEYRAMSEQTLELWQPLAETFNQFDQRHLGKIRVWKAGSAYPDRAAIEEWLMTQVASGIACWAS